MSISKPSIDEVAQLIKETKHFLNSVKTIPTITDKYDKDFHIASEYNNVEYLLHVYRGKIDRMRYSIHLRFKSEAQNKHLVRLDMNSGNNHKNNDGTKVGRSHIHILQYNVNDKECVEYAYSFNDIPWYINDVVTFNADDELINSFDNFLKFVNIK